MKFQLQHGGKWVAAKDDKIIADAKTLSQLMKEIKKTEDPAKLKFSLVPKGFIAGFNAK